MPFDNEAFTKWLREFEETLVQCGMPVPQAMKYRTVHYNQALGYFTDGKSPSDAAVMELLG